MHVAEGLALSVHVCQVLDTVMYVNEEEVEPREGVTVAVFVVTDDAGASSQNVSVFIHVSRKNDRPEVNLGVGFGHQDDISFMEIPQGENSLGVHIVSRPHRIEILDEEEARHHIAQVNVQLR